MECSLYKSKGIYAIRNKITGEVYVGQTANNFGDRRDCNFAKLRNDNHDNVNLQQSWDTHGEDNFEFVVLEYLDDCSCIDDREKFWIAKYRNENKAFNIQSGGKDGGVGLHLSEHAKRLIGEKNRLHNLGKKASVETKRKMSLARRGRIVSEETRQKLRIANLGKKQSLETRTKSSIAHSGERSVLAKYTKEQVLKAREIYDGGCNDYKYISSQTGISYGAINGIVKRKRWKYI